MAVNLAPPDPASLHPVPGVELGVAMAGVRKADRKDLLVMRLAEGSAAAGVFPPKPFCAAPAILARKNLEEGDIRPPGVKNGNAKAGTRTDALKPAPQGRAPPSG